MKMAELNLNHLGDHLNAYMQKGGVSQNPQFKQLNDFYRQFKDSFMKAVQIHEAHKTVAALTGNAPVAPAGSSPSPLGLPAPTGGATNVAPGTIAAGAPQGGPPIPSAGADLGFKGNATAQPPPQPAAR